jgi:hypothetical protein
MAQRLGWRGRGFLFVAWWTQHREADMTDENFADNLMRVVAAELHLLNGLTAAREMFGKSYFSLGAGEKAAVDQAVLGMIAANYQWVTPENLAAQQAQRPMGFLTPTEQKS